MSDDLADVQTTAPPPLPALPAFTLTDGGLIALAERADRLVSALKLIRAAVLKLTNERDWENLGDTPYLNEGGAAKVGRTFGVSWQIQTSEREDLPDGHFVYRATGTFEFHGQQITAFGARSSTDPWYCKAKGREIPASEIDRTDVEKGAQTNCIGRGVKDLLALKNYTWEELKAAGIDPSHVARVQYQDRSADPNAVPLLPNYGEYKGRPINDGAVPIPALEWYAAGLAKSLTDPAKKTYRMKNTELCQAIVQELDTRKHAQPLPAASAMPEVPPGLTPDQWVEAIDYLAADPNRNDILKVALAEFKSRSCAVLAVQARQALLERVQVLCEKTKIPCRALLPTKP